MKLSSWRQTVGPSVVYAPPAPWAPARTSGRVIVVNWNVHVGHGNVSELVNEITRREQASGHQHPEFVLLLQESFRRGSEIPFSPGSSMPRRIAPPSSAGDIRDLARKLGWWMYYVPSMRNGNQIGNEAEDRGNAILSSLPLEKFEAVELPFIVQRRVALIATVTDAEQQPKLRVVVAHLDTRAPWSEGWILGGPAARSRQAEALAARLKTFAHDDVPLVFGADLNTLFGSGEPAVDTISKVVTHRDCGRKSTHAAGFVLDHMFAQLPDLWPTPSCHRMDDTYGSDHYPLVLSLEIPK